MFRLVAVLILLLVTGCAANGGGDPAPGLRFEAWKAETDEYRLRPGDEIEVRLTYNPELNDRFVIAPDGTISLPLVGFVQVSGATPRQVQAYLTQLYSKELRRPDVAVIPRIFAPRRIYVGGEVQTPGVYDMAGDTGVLQAIVAAGGFRTTAADEEVVLIRRTPRNTPMMRRVDVRSIFEEGNLTEDVPLTSLDIVYVPRSGIAEAGVFVEQYIRNMLPFYPSVGYALN